MTYYGSSISGCRLTIIIRPMCSVLESNYSDCFSGFRLTNINSLLFSSKVTGSTIASGVHCLVHDVNIHLLAFQFGRLITGGLSCRLTIKSIANLRLLLLLLRMACSPVATSLRGWFQDDTSGNIWAHRVCS